jgi:GxxExxY protein
MSDRIHDSRDPRTYAIIGAAMEVHRELQQGFLENAHQCALAAEFKLCFLPFAREVDLPIFYKEQQLECKYRADFICFGSVVEVKASKQLTEIDRAQVINYLRATRFEVAVLLNFGGKSLEYERIVLSRKP